MLKRHRILEDFFLAVFVVSHGSKNICFRSAEERKDLEGQSRCDVSK